MAHDESRTQRAKRFVADWAWHLGTLAAVVAVVALAPRQVPLIVYKSALSMVGACGGYWLFVAFFGKWPEYGDEADRWQTVVLMGVVMLSLSMGA